MGIKRGEWMSGSVNKGAVSPLNKSGVKSVAPAKNGMSGSQAHLVGRNDEDVSVSGKNKLSKERQQHLVRGTENDDNKQSNASPVIVNSNSFISSSKIKDEYSLNKTASIYSNDRSRFGTGGGDTVRQAPEVYSPLFQIANLQLPRDRITMNAWNRNFYDTHPLVHNCINLHATYPIGKINIKCKNKEIQDFFNAMIDDMDLTNTLQAIALEFWKIGEVFPYAELDEERGVWKNIVIQNPDYIHVKTSVLGGESVISMKPDAALQRLVHSSSPSDMQLRSNIGDEIIHHVKKGNNIPLDNFHVSHLKLLSSPYDIHGTSPIVSVYKDLMLYDKLRESKFAQADNLVNPITLIKVGGNSEGEYRPTPEDLEQWRQTFEAAQYDKDFKIISHSSVSVERVGASGQIIDISGDMDFILKNILHGLMVPEAVITQEGSTFGSASVGLEVLRQRYQSFRNMIDQWLIKKIFAPISEIQEFYEYSDGIKKLIVPDIEWNNMILFDMSDYVNSLTSLVSEKKVSKETLFKSLGLNIDEENRLIRAEMIYEAIVEKEIGILKTLTLGALRSLKSDEDIIEPTEEPLPGTPGSDESGIPGADSDGLGDMDMGGDMGLGDMGLGGGGDMDLGGGGDMGFGGGGDMDLGGGGDMGLGGGGESAPLV